MKVATPLKTKSRLKQVLLKIRSFREKNQQKCIDCLKPRSNENELECKMYSCNEFYVPNYQSFSLVILSILQCIKLAVLSKIKSHSDAINYFKELPYYNKPIGKPMLNT